MALATASPATAAEGYFVADQAAGSIWRLEDTNGDGDALDPDERTMWANGFSLLGELASIPGSLFAVDEAAGRVIRLTDNNHDGDALDISEQLLWSAGFSQPQGISFDSRRVFVTESAAGEVWQLVDLNGDGDALDSGEQTIFADNLSLGMDTFSIDASGGHVFVVDSAAEVVHRLLDGNSDGDALDPGESLVVTPAISGARGIAIDALGTLFVSSTATNRVFRIADLNGDGDMLDVPEVVVYADAVYGGLGSPRAVVATNDGDLFVTNSASGQVHLLRDVNGDGDALDIGESVPYATGVGFGVSIVFDLIDVLPGDYNGNGTVDAADFTVWRDNLGKSITLTNEDPGTTPGQVTQEDYNFWKAHFGETAGSGSGVGSNAAVPEPSMAVLVLVAGLIASVSGLRRHSK